MMRIFHTTFKQKNLTGNAGLSLLGRFAQKLNLHRILDRHISIQRGDTATYQVGDAILILIMGVLAGAKHISHLAILRSDAPLRKLFKWDQFPDDTTFGRIFRLFTYKHCKELSEVEDKLRRKIWSKKYFGKVTLDLDSTVRPVFGSQEGAAKGYNPKKKGQKAYHPLLCFVYETRECLHNWFRAGDAYSANGCVEFIKECFARLPKRVWSVIVRADSAFFNGDLLDFLEDNGARYMIKVKLKGLESLLNGQKWRKIKNSSFESTEFEFKCGGWKKARRFVAVREIATSESNDTLFPQPMIQHKYFCYVSNMNLTPWASHKYYGKRATSENWIEWCKNHMASGSILTQEFWANSAIFQCCILAYNLMVWMMWINYEKGFKEEPNTIRMYLVHVPARLVHRSRQWFLDLDERYPFKKLWQNIEASILSLEFV